MDYKSGETLPDDSPQRRDSLDAVATKFCHILEKLVVEEEWTLSEGIFLFGFGAGATLAMKVCLKWSKNGYAPLGGAICVAGGVVATDMSTTQQNMTPLLLMVGEKDNFFDPEKAREAARSYGANVTAIHVAPDKGRQMISSPAEMQQIMKFLSGRLLKLSNVPM
jgi:predicted esterase